jgi:hypothetical protein
MPTPQEVTTEPELLDGRYSVLLVLFAHSAMKPFHQIDGILKGIWLDRSLQCLLDPHHLGIRGLGLHPPLGRQTCKLATAMVMILPPLH